MPGAQVIHLGGRSVTLRNPSLRSALCPCSTAVSALRFLMFGSPFRAPKQFTCITSFERRI